MTTLFNISIYAYLMAFLRIGTVFMLMPAFSASYVASQIRLTLALAVSFILTPMIIPELPPQPDNFSLFLQYALFEITIGVFLGMIMQILFFALNLAGSIASQSIGFANAQIFDPAFQTQSMLIETFLSIVALTVVFVGDFHHLMIEALVDSYKLLPPAAALPVEDMGNHFTQAVNDAFVFGFKLGSPFIAFTIVFYAGMGLVSRLMPQLNIFFLSMPLQIYLGLGLLFITVPVILTVFFRYYGDGLGFFID